MRNRVVLITSICVSVLLLASGPAAAQNTGAISGTVVDESGQVVPGATVTIVNERTGATRTLTSDSGGDFAFQAVPPGSYTVRVELSGFRTLERKANILTASGALALGNVKLLVGSLTEVLTVEVQGTKVETTNSDHAGLLTSTQIEQIQTKGRDVMNLLRLVPGVRYDGDRDALGDSFGSDVPHVGGMRRAWNQVTVDGVNGNELSGTSKFAAAINLDAIAEVKVLLNTYKAEFGRTGGANIQIVSKSGGADYNGNLYYYGRRDSWNANSWGNGRNKLPRAKYVHDTYGFNFGGPVKIPGVYDQKDGKKLFFFYSLEAPQVRSPRNPRQYRMPTALERNGDFSKTFDTNGRLIVIRDPLTGQPFAGNVIPAGRLDPNGRAILNRFPLPNRLDQPDTAQWNFIRQETPENPRWNHFGRVDWRPGEKDSFYLTVRSFDSTQTGTEIPGSPRGQMWGLLNTKYVFGDKGITAGHTRVFSSNVINEASFGIRRQTEGFPPATDADYESILRSNVGVTLGQFSSGLNPDGVIPKAIFGLASTAGDCIICSPDIDFPDRINDTAVDMIASFQDNLTWIKGSHQLKAGVYLEYLRNNEARGGDWMGRIEFNNNTANPLNTGHAFSNAALGVFQQYREAISFSNTRNKAYEAEWYLQDSWKATRRLTVDYGLRFLWYQPYYRQDGKIANFVPELYDRAKAPRLYQPAIINGQRRAYDPATGQVLSPIYIGAFVPGTGDQANGMQLATDPGAPKGFRESQGIQPEPRIGFAWDVFGSGKTALHGSAGLFHQARLGGGSAGNLRNPPFSLTPAVSFGTLATLVQPGTTLLNRPQDINALEVNAQTPSAYNWSLGVQQDIGWGTVLDLSYVGSVGRHMEMYYDINPIPDGARFLDQHPENRDPTLANAALPPEFLRPYRGYQRIRVRGNWGTANYNALQVQISRRYIKGFQFSVAYSYSRSLGLADEDPGDTSSTISRPAQQWLYSPLAHNQMHNLVVNYTWSLPKASKLVDHSVVRFLFDGWQVSGENAFVSGDWASVFLTTVDNFDFTGGDFGNGADAGGNFRYVRPRLVGNPKLDNPDPLTGWFNTAAFVRPNGRGDYGNAPRNVVRRPGINNWNLAAFKNFSLGGKRNLQFRAEAYNVLNHTQFSDIDRTARFDANGNQTNPNFGLANEARQPRIIQISARLRF
jgi:hypothetical protein